MPIATQIRQFIVLGVYIRKDVGATSSTCPTVKVFALPSRLDKQ